MTWAQQGREHKQKELAKSETYAEKGVIKPKEKARKKRFGMEYRYTAEICAYWGEKQSIFGKDYREWRPFYTWYETEKQRDQAMEALSKKMFLDKALYHEYRAIER